MKGNGRPAAGDDGPAAGLGAIAAPGVRSAQGAGAPSMAAVPEAAHPGRRPTGGRPIHAVDGPFLALALHHPPHLFQLQRRLLLAEAPARPGCRPQRPSLLARWAHLLRFDPISFAPSSDTSRSRRRLYSSDLHDLLYHVGHQAGRTSGEREGANMGNHGLLHGLHRAAWNPSLCAALDQSFPLAEASSRGRTSSLLLPRQRGSAWGLRGNSAGVDGRRAARIPFLGSR